MEQRRHSYLHVNDKALHNELTRIVFRNLVPVSVGLGILFLAFAISHLLVLPASTAAIMSPIAGATSAVLFVLTVLLKRHLLPSRWSHAIGAGIAGLVLLNSLLHLALTADLKQTTNLLLLIVGIGSLFLSTPWLVLSIGTTLVSWGIVVLARPTLTAAYRSAALHYGIALISATALSLIVYFVKIRRIREMQRLRQRDEQRKRVLSDALQTAQENEERYRDLLDHANDLVQSVGFDGDILYVNRAWRERLGYSKENLADLTIFDIIHPDNHAHYEAILQRLTEEECDERIQTKFVTKSGEVIIVEGNINCRFEDGKPVATRGIFRDVTERVKTERALQRQNRELTVRNAVARALAGPMDLGHFWNDALSKITAIFGFTGGLITIAYEDDGDLSLFSHTGLPTPMANRLETQGLKGTLCETVYQTKEPLILEDLQSETPENARRLLEMGLHAYVGFPIIRRNRVLGTLCLFNERPRALSKADQTLLEIVGRQIGMAAENTRLFEQSRKRQLYLEGLLSAAPDAIITLDAQHRIVEWNAGAERLFGYSRDEVIGRDLDPLITTAATQALAQDFTQRVMHGEVLAPSEVTRHRKDGSPVEVLVAGSPIIIDDEFAGAVAIYTDITELKQAQEALRKHAEELEERNEELDAFAHTVAHDLKNPLQNLIGYADFLKYEYESLPEDLRQEAITTIVKTADRMNNIIEELLLLSAVRRGEVVTDPLDMAAIVANAQKRLDYMIDEYKATINKPETWPTAYGQAAWVEEVWTNYLSNALKYGGRPPLVELGATVQPDGSVRFWVRDNGEGMTEEEQAKLFTPFTRLHQVKAEGHGLGLSIVRRIVDKLGGQVGVKSEPGKGSTFFFTLPAS
jgi:PAS domain S-box-containing protein